MRVHAQVLTADKVDLRCEPAEKAGMPHARPAHCHCRGIEARPACLIQIFASKLTPLPVAPSINTLAWKL